MKYHLKYLLFGLILLNFSEICRANQPDLAQAFTMSPLTLTPGAYTQVGDTVHITVTFLANITGDAVLNCQFPGYIAPPD